MLKLTKKHQSFVDYIKKSCKEKGIKCELRNVGYVKISKTEGCTGYFDDYNKKLVCSMKAPDAFHVLVHEYAHFTQWVDQCKVWTSLGDSLDIVDRWLSGEDFEDIDDHITACMNLELDCEKRAVKIIQEFGLKINLEEYVKKANAYVLFYDHMRRIRSWCKKENMPYRNKVLIKAMPSTFKINYKKPPKKLMDIYVKEGI
jgi:hypothetical protein